MISEFALWFQVWFACKLFMTVVTMFDTLDVDAFHSRYIIHDHSLLKFSTTFNTKHENDNF